MTSPLPHGSTIGILGGGQLGRMLSVAAARLGYKCHIYEPNPDAPAADVAYRVTCAPYDDKTALAQFAASVDVVTYEFENVPTAALDLIEAEKPIRPNRRALAISQDRLDEKEFLTSLDLNVAPYAKVDNTDDLRIALAKTGTPAILKTRRFGYDGKGQVRIQAIDEAADAISAIKGAPAVLEGFVDFSSEVSVIAARAVSGEISAYDPGENVHVDGILNTTTVPAPLPASEATDAILMAGKILNALDYVGVIGLELFVTPQGLVVNEFAPRVHNSGHWTQNGCQIDQFEQHIRAVAGLPLGDGRRHADITMENLIGDDMDRLPDLLKDPNAALHLYGKTQARPGRKMGHVNRITQRT